MKKTTFFLVLAIILTGFFQVKGENKPRGNNTIDLRKNVSSINQSGVRKVKDLIIYRDTMFYSAFPSVIKRPDGEILLAFRRAPERRLFGQEGVSHTDPNSYLVMVRSRDGENWTSDPELIYAHPFGGSQDPCLLQLTDGTLLCTGYTWGLIRPDADQVLNRPITLVKSKSEQLPAFTFLGGYLVRSTDGGDTWTGPVYPPNVPAETQADVWGKPLPAYNRGALCEGKDSKIYWAVAARDVVSPAKTSVYLLISEDKGLSWSYSCPVAVDNEISFNETSLYETPNGDLVAFLRTADMPDHHSCIARSSDGGKSFRWQSMNFYGYPLHALKLPDNRVLLTYGYRNKPYGIRGRILNPECSDFETAAEFVIRDDGGTSDLGYSWAVQLDKKRVLVVYYFNTNNGNRYIAGTILEIQS
ncbi:sialidase family protein [Gaoshiqia sp. Z1-71]|uniref:sialidase family protein n=1 Tax=Gaoshiqia hydrogeniformans TaxID=3290090 RepID=UPI003BF82257